MIRRSGQQGVPVTVIGDEVVVGFDQARLERILGQIGASRSAGNGARKPLGAKVADASRYALPGGEALPGAYVGSVKAGSPAEAAGMRIGDIIVAVGDTAVRSAEELSRALGSLSGGAARMTIRRGATTRNLTVEL